LEIRKLPVKKLQLLAMYISLTHNDAVYKGDKQTRNMPATNIIFFYKTCQTTANNLSTMKLEKTVTKMHITMNKTHTEWLFPEMHRVLRRVHSVRNVINRPMHSISVHFCRCVHAFTDHAELAV